MVVTFGGEVIGMVMGCWGLGAGRVLFLDPDRGYTVALLLFSCSVITDSLQPPGPPGSSVRGIFQARFLE